ncbi:MAG: EAL domain-containing protein (putative c-di-GMP-specific phosphodiesterase class I), partial [Phenylobacterium sp.]
YPHCGKDCDSLMKAADAAMYAVKNGGRNGFRFFSSEMQRLVVDRHALETALNDALSHQELSLHYQPLVEADTGRVMATEALIRWHNPLLGPILPSQFIAIAEDLGLINGIGAWVLLTACQQNELWSADLASEPPLMVTINVSLMQLQSAKFVEQLSVLLTQISIAPQQLVVEITEDCLSSAPELVAEVLNQIHALGVLIAIDDFGSGYSSLAVLCSLPLAWLKIDPCFIGGIGVDKAAEGMVKSIIAMAHNLSIKAVAEGVENQQQVDFLKQHRCDMLQGYHIAGPANADVITGILAKKVLS